jgi:signal transduction histidine kinase
MPCRTWPSFSNDRDTRLAEAPIVVMGDPLRLAQVFTNLLSNAIRYTPDGGHIRVTLTREAQEAVVRFRDDGIGIRAEDLPHLFDSFSRGTSRHPNIHMNDGLGLGLTLVQRLTTQHDGSLEARSDGPGKGSEFVVSIPVYSNAASPADSAEPKAKAQVESRPRRILVVDDNQDLTDSCKVLLETKR